ncbi:MAG: DDE-type integrase/transposase/recombinase [Armatimonadetes bacterium]|nr:DDE-type integrase/transposase/recombinase [Armatimonadota bacterium]
MGYFDSQSDSLTLCGTGSGGLTAEEGIHLLSGILHQAGHHVDVGVHRQADLRMAQELHDGARPKPLGEKGIIGWSRALHLRTELVLGALEMALAQRRRSPGTICHSDHGSQYASLAFGKRCREAGVRPSRGTVGDACDNAVQGSFFATLECEPFDRRRFSTRSEAKMAVFRFIKGWYNPKRRHSGLDCLSPMNNERRHMAEA